MKLHRTKFGVWSISLLGSLILRALAWSLKWHWVGFEGDAKYWVDGPPRIMAFWHSQQLCMPFVFLACSQNPKSASSNMLISRHGDGRLIAKTIKRLGINSIAGSSTRGGKEALRKLIRAAKNGEHVGITPDGPRGPVHKCKKGIIDLAQMTGVPIFPVALVAKDEWRLGSWDAMRIPKPFSSIVAIAGEPILVNRKLKDGESLQLMEAVDVALNVITEQAERYFEEPEKASSRV